MSENPPEALTPLAAVEYLRSLPPIEATIRARIEGLLWMVWSLIVAATFLSYAAVKPRGLEAALLALPWLAAGVVTSLVVRRSVAIPLPPITKMDRVALAGAAGAIIIVAVLGINLRFPVPTASLVLLAVSLFAWPLTKAILPHGIPGKTALLGSALGVVTAVGLMAMGAGNITSAVVSACVCGTWFLLGAWAALRG